MTEAVEVAVSVTVVVAAVVAEVAVAVIVAVGALDVVAAVAAEAVVEATSDLVKFCHNRFQSSGVRKMFYCRTVTHFSLFTNTKCNNVFLQHRVEIINFRK